MTTLRTTAIMKTDIRDSTARFRMLPEVDLHTLHTEHTEHRQFVARLAQAHGRSRRQRGEGDGYPMGGTAPFRRYRPAFAATRWNRDL